MHLPIFEVISYEEWQQATEKELWDIVHHEMVELSDYLWKSTKGRAERAVLEERSNWDDESKAKWDKPQLEYFSKLLKEIRRDEFDRSRVLGFDRLMLIKMCLLKLGMPDEFKSSERDLDTAVKYIIDSRNGENQKFENELRIRAHPPELNKRGLIKPHPLLPPDVRAQVEANNRRKQREYKRMHKA